MGDTYTRSMVFPTLVYVAGVGLPGYPKAHLSTIFVTTSTSSVSATVRSANVFEITQTTQSLQY